MSIGSRGARTSCKRRLEQSLYSYHRGDYSRALMDLERTCESAATAKDWTVYVEACSFLLRILAEREEFARIEKIESRLLEILKSEELPAKLKSRAMYTLGICSCYQDTRHELAMRRFREAIEFAITSEDRIALASPLYGAATVLYARKMFDDALKELERLETLLSCLSVPDLASATHLLRSMIHRNQGELDQALEAAWKAFESLKHNPNLVLYLHTLCALGTIQNMKGDRDSARLYLDLADRSLKRDEFPRIARLVDEAIVTLGGTTEPTADLVFDSRTGVLVERRQGEIRFEGQFILRDLLRVFLESPGRVFAKEDLVKAVWRESYNPKVHDNKIYVTIKRLRKLLEADDAKTEYIMRAKNGYFLNPKTRVLIVDERANGDTTTEVPPIRMADDGNRFQASAQHHHRTSTTKQKSGSKGSRADLSLETET